MIDEGGGDGGAFGGAEEAGGGGEDEEGFDGVVVAMRLMVAASCSGVGSPFSVRNWKWRGKSRGEREEVAWVISDCEGRLVVRTRVWTGLVGAGVDLPGRWSRERGGGLRVSIGCGARGSRRGIGG